eukprot:scpid57700/ scgid6755/ RNA-directed DNA polymerase from mobile element jockey; Reverse transcriptase
MSIVENQPTDLNANIELFQGSITEALDHHCPVRIVTFSTKYKPAPWVDDELRKLLYRRKRAHRLLLKQPGDQQRIQSFRALRRECKITMRRKKANYFQAEFINNRRNPRRQWSAMNSLLGRTKVSREPGASIADITSIFSEIVGPLPPTETSDALTLASVPDHPSNIPPALPCGPQSDGTLVSFTRITAGDVKFHLRAMDSRKASGPDAIPPLVYKLVSDQIAPTLASLLSISLETGEFPTPYKLAHVRPIHKRGDVSDPRNYRPISLLPLMSKLLERCALEQLTQYMDSASHMESLPAVQFAYRKNHSCDDLLALVANDWSQSLDQNEYVAAAFLDMSKAFDTVNHSLLLQELFEIGVGGVALRWFASYLTDRQQRVVTKSSRGACYSASRGVPQGSILGPVLFNLAVRKLPECVASTKVRQFADDVSVYKSGRDPQKLTADLARDVLSIRNFLRDHGLKLNAEKTQFIIFRPKSKAVPANLQLSIDSTSIPPSATIKYLGLLFDEHLTYRDHITLLERKIGTKLAVFRKIKHNLTPAAKRVFYCSFIQAQLEYGSNAFAHSLQVSQMDRITRISNRAVRIVFGYPKYYDASLVLARNYLAAISLRYQFRLFVLVFRALHKLCSPLLSTCFLPRTATSQTSARTRSDSQSTLSLSLPLVSRRYGLYSLSFLGSDRWNALPADIRTISLLRNFRSSTCIQQFIGYPVKMP